MYLVTKRKDWYKNKMIAIFGGVRIWQEDRYYVLCLLKTHQTMLINLGNS